MSSPPQKILTIIFLSLNPNRAAVFLATSADIFGHHRSIAAVAFLNHFLFLWVIFYIGILSNFFKLSIPPQGVGKSFCSTLFIIRSSFSMLFLCSAETCGLFSRLWISCFRWIRQERIWTISSAVNIFISFIVVILTISGFYTLNFRLSSGIFGFFEHRLPMPPAIEDVKSILHHLSTGTSTISPKIPFSILNVKAIFPHIVEIVFHVIREDEHFIFLWVTGDIDILSKII